MDFLAVLQAWHREDPQIPAREEWVKPLNPNLLPLTGAMRATVFGQDTTKTVT